MTELPRLLMSWAYILGLNKMNDNYSKFCILLASAKYTGNDAYDIAQELKEIGPNQFAEDIDKARKIISHFAKRERDFVGFRQEIENPFAEAEKKITHLLVEESKLPKNVSAELLEHEIRLRYPDLILPTLGRKGFRDWLMHIFQRVPPSEILHLAITIRNRYVKESEGDWRLK